MWIRKAVENTSVRNMGEAVLKDEVGLVMYKGCQILEQLRRYLIGNP